MNKQLKIAVMIVSVLVLGIGMSLYRLYYQPLDMFTPLPHPPSHPQVEHKKLFMVQISGAIHRPGVYQIEKGARVMTVVKAAGGAVANANLNGVNLAKKLRDGQHIKVPYKKRDGEQQSKNQETAGADQPSDFPVSLNHAGAKELARVPHISMRLAKRIVTFRQTHGSFISLDDLTQVKGIGVATVKKVSGYLTLENHQ